MSTGRFFRLDEDKQKQIGQLIAKVVMQSFQQNLLVRLLQISAVCIIIGTAALCNDCPAFASEGGPGAREQAAALPQEEEAGILDSLKDGLLEYGELADMIHYYNPSVQAIAANYRKSLSDYEVARQELRDAKELADRDRDGAKNRGDMEDYSYYSAQKATYGAGIEAYSSVLESLKRPSNMASQRKTERRLTMAAQSLMISYESLIAQEATAEKLMEIHEKQYQIGQQKVQAGVSVTGELLTAQSNRKQAEASLISIRGQKEMVYDSLCVLVGQENDGSLQIAGITAPDAGTFFQRNLDEDIEKAIGNNEQLIEDRVSLKTDSTAATNRKLRTMEDGEEQLAITMQQLYDAVIQGQEQMSAGDTAYQIAEKKRQTAGIQAAQGMISQEEYLQSELAYLQSESQYRAAMLNLQQAMDTYDWAVSGIVN